MSKTLTPLPLLSSYALPWPVDWRVLFGAARPLILEIGFGYGHFLQHLSRQNPDASVIGLEISNECLVKAEKAIVRLGMSNTRVIYSTAETALHHLFEPASLSQIHINFPDPWFKVRHAGRRLMQRDTLDAIVSRLQPGAAFYLATDILDYAEMTAELLVETPALSNRQPTLWTNTIGGRVETKYERKAREAGRACYYFAYERNTLPAPDVPVKRELPMPHLILESPQTFDDIAAAFTPQSHQVGEISVRFIAAYRSSHNLLFETFVHEPTVEQRVGLVLVQRDDEPGEYTLKLGAIGNPRPTEGMHVAVALLGQWLTRLHPQAHITESKVRAIDGLDAVGRLDEN